MFISPLEWKDDNSRRKKKPKKTETDYFKNTFCIYWLGSEKRKKSDTILALIHFEEIIARFLFSVWYVFEQESKQ